MTFEEFVEKYCDGKTPTRKQQAAIESMLSNPRSQEIWLTGKGGGKWTLQRWLTKFAKDCDGLPLGHNPSRVGSG